MEIDHLGFDDNFNDQEKKNYDQIRKMRMEVEASINVADPGTVQSTIITKKHVQLVHIGKKTRLSLM